MSNFIFLLVRTALMAHVFLDTVVGPFVLVEILLAQERFAALAALERSGSDLVSFGVGFVRVFRGEIFAAVFANVGSHTRMSVDVFFQKILRAEKERNENEVKARGRIDNNFRNHLYLFPQVSQGHDFTCG